MKFKARREYTITMQVGEGIIKKNIMGYSVAVQDYEEYEFFVHHNEGILPSGMWKVSEVSTGFCFPVECNGSTREEAVRNAEKRLGVKGPEFFRKVIGKAKAICKSGVVPFDYPRGQALDTPANVG